MGQKQKIREAKKASGDLKVDKTTKAGYDRQNVAEVIKRLKAMAKEDTNRFDKMGLEVRAHDTRAPRCPFPRARQCSTHAHVHLGRREK